MYSTKKRCLARDMRTKILANILTEFQSHPLLVPAGSVLLSQTWAGEVLNTRGLRAEISERRCFTRLQEAIGANRFVSPVVSEALHPHVRCCYFYY